MRSGGNTQIGGGGDAFQTTHWTQVLGARTTDAERQREVTGRILGSYWKPVYCYLRRKGYDNEKAKDLTQGFFAKILEGKLIQKANRAKGKFRSFLLTALDHYVTSVHRAKTARKRMPSKGLIRLDGIDSPNVPELADNATPAQAFIHAWASALLDEVLAEVKAGCCQSGQEAHWLVFHARVVQPIQEDSDPPSLSDLCGQHGIDDEAKVSNMLITVKRRFRKVLRLHVRQFVGSEKDVDREIQDLMKILSGPGAGS